MNTNNLKYNIKSITLDLNTKNSKFIIMLNKATILPKLN